jgi:hypothetical protein
MQGEAKGVNRRGQQLRRHAIVNARRGAVGGQDVPLPVDGEGGVGQVAAQDHIDHLARATHFRGVQGPLGEHRGVAAGYQQHIALAHGNLQPLGQGEDHPPTGGGAACLHEAQVAGGNLRLQGEVELAHPPALSPHAYVVADLWNCGAGHGHHERHLSSAISGLR